MAQFVHDTFTDTAGTALTSHTGETGATWNNHGSYVGTVVISDENRARKNDVSSVAPYASGSPATADYEVITRLRFKSVVTAEFRGVTGRVNTGANTFYWAAWNNNAWTLRKVVGGSSTTLGTASWGTQQAGEDWLLKLRMVGASIKLLVKGPAASEWTEVVGVTDSAITDAGKAGLLGVTNNQTNTTGAHWDYIEANDILASPVLSFESANDTEIELSWTDPSGGTSPFTYDVHRSTISGFTPEAGNLVEADVTSPYTDDDPTLTNDGQIYFYKVVSTDSAGTPNVTTSNQQAASLRETNVVIGFIGDSITDGSGVAIKPGTLAAAHLEVMHELKNVTASNAGVSASKTSDWVSESSNLTTAKSQFASAGVTLVHVMLGTNDAKDTNAVSASTYLSNLTSLVNDLVGAGYTVVLAYPPAFAAGVTAGFTEAALGRLQTYLPQIDSLVNGTTIRRGAQSQFNYFAENTSQLAADGVHMSTAGNEDLAVAWSEALEDVLSGEVSGASGVSRGRLVNAGA